MKRKISIELPAPRTKPPKRKVMAPKTRDEAAVLLARIGTLSIARAQAELVARKKINAILEAMVGEIAPVEPELEASLKALRQWADAHRGVLLEGGAKTVALATGELYWRLGAEAIALAEGIDEDSLIAQLLDRDLDDFLRIAESLDRERIKAEWPAIADKVDGLRRVQREFFYVAPKALDAPIEVKTRAEHVVAESKFRRKEKAA